MSPGLKRAREPYRVKNAILGLSLAAFAVGVWAYSISAVKQDVFDDVDEEAEALAATGTGTGLGVGVLAKAKAEEDGRAAAAAATATAGAGAALTASSPPLKTSSVLDEVAKVGERARAGRGLLSHLDNRLPWLLDPERKTLVWGAPPVDNVGKMGRRS
ncbi:hypothetical protein CVT25_012068 [Psilocybe cyanescens]|uniref:Cytochrome c oxidase assembly factor 3 n=1 Tax=Psilocybe cyanescens TaxID=93625 RepID=A0A409VMU2_PSICY|nr:hypothetical protein CVT25_012068 [Psilocybe cyanescens]